MAVEPAATFEASKVLIRRSGGGLFAAYAVITEARRIFQKPGWW